MAKKAPFKLLYNNDCTNTFGCTSPWHEAGEVFREKDLIASIDETAGTGVDAHFLAPGLGWVPWWQSKSHPPAEHLAWWRSRTGLNRSTQFGFDQYVADGGDMVKVLIERCKAGGMAPFATFRVNDVHQQEYYDEKDQKSIFVSRFYTEHLEFMIDPGHKQRKGFYPFRGLDFAQPAVREFKLSLLRELATDYDLAGIELDFLRDDHIFHQDKTTHEQRVSIITDLLHEVRVALDSRKVPGHPHRWLCVRIPCELSRHSAIGLDVAKLAAAGVDMFNLSSWYHTPQQTDAAEVRRLVPNSTIYVEMTHSCGNHPYFIDQGGGYGTLSFPRCADSELRTSANLALTRGADGMSLFNFVYYRKHAKDADIPIIEPPFYMLKQLRDPALLASKPQHYTLASTIYFNRVPRPLKPSEPTILSFDIALPRAKAKAPALGEADEEIYPRETPNPHARLRLHFREPVGNRTIAVTLNGKPVESTTDITRFYGNPFDTMISPAPNRVAFEFPRAQLQEGINTLEIRLTAGEPAELIYADMGVR